MAISSRAAWAVGLLGVAGVVGPAYGQGDGAVRKAAGNGSAPAASAPKAEFRPTIVATIDLEAIVRGYEKYKFQVEQLKAESLAKQGQLKSVFAEAQQIAKEMEKLQQGSKDFNDRNNKLTELKAKLQAGQETLKREDEVKYVELMANTYKEAQEMTTAYARSRGIQCVLKIANEPMDSQNPDSVMAAMARPVMYSDPALDITRSVLYNLNKTYVEAGGPVVKAPAVGAATTDEATTPASAERTAPAASQGQGRPAGNTGRTAPPRGQK